MKTFEYMSGSGNTFYIDKDLDIKSDIEVISYVADSKIDIDGVISVSVNSDVENTLDMEYYNSDGSSAELCVNGLRCAAKYAFDKKYFTDSTIYINTFSGIIETTIEDNNNVSSKISYPNFPNGMSQYEFLGLEGFIVDVGNPHFVINVEDVNSIDLDSIGHKFQKIKFFEKGINIEFYNLIDKNKVNARVYERGVGETLACGSGAVAIFATLLNNDLVSNTLSVNYPGGELILNEINNKINLSGEIIYL